jgi:hypothetical protein
MSPLGGRMDAVDRYAIGKPTTVAGCPSICTDVPAAVKSRCT